MTTVQAFILGMMVAWSPALLLLAWFLVRYSPQNSNQTR
jgi:hypothetical protein